MTRQTCKIADLQSSVKRGVNIKLTGEEVVIAQVPSLESFGVEEREAGPYGALDEELPRHWEVISHFEHQRVPLDLEALSEVPGGET